MYLKPFYYLFLLFLSLNIFAQHKVDKIESIPYDLKVYNSPIAYKIGNNSIEITSDGKTNLFNNPNGSIPVQNASMILFEPDENFTLSAKVSGQLKEVYDVAALVIYQDKNTWAKLCYEYSVKKRPTIVSVVTRTYSDDCNSEETGEYAYLSVVKKGNEFSFFYSTNEKDWTMVRSFHLETKNPVKVGFASHGSRGKGSTAKFSEIKYRGEALSDMRTL